VNGIVQYRRNIDHHDFPIVTLDFNECNCILRTALKIANLIYVTMPN